jgi:hypothetical protein
MRWALALDINIVVTAVEQRGWFNYQIYQKISSHNKDLRRLLSFWLPIKNYFWPFLTRLLKQLPRPPFSTTNQRNPTYKHPATQIYASHSNTLHPSDIHPPSTAPTKQRVIKMMMYRPLHHHASHISTPSSCHQISFR